MNRSATIADFVTSMLCDLDTPKMSTQSAASWGYFNTETNQWNREILEMNGFPVYLLPEIVQPGASAGTLKKPWHNIRAGIPVGLFKRLNTVRTTDYFRDAKIRSRYK